MHKSFSDRIGSWNLSSHTPQHHEPSQRLRVRERGKLILRSQKINGMVKVKFFAKFREIAGKKEMEFEARDVRSLLREISRRDEELGKAILEDRDGVKPRKVVRIFVNGREIKWLRGLNTQLQENDVVSIFPPVGGG